jgi:hypothetical protein
LTASAGLSTALASQVPYVSVRGVVRDTAGAPIEGAHIALGRRLATTNSQGAFRVDSVRPGRYSILVRLVGHTPIQEPVEVTVPPAELRYVLVPAALLLPTIEVEGRRTGIYGVIGDPSMHAAVGAQVQVYGFRGGEAVTDSLGRFAFPAADRGVYMVRVTYPGYRERRFTVELERGEGRELAVQLMPSSEIPSRGDEWVLKDLRLRLAMGMSWERRTAASLQGVGSLPLCNAVPGPPFLTIILNGRTVYRDFPKTFLCFWRADEIELVEFGPEICREVSNSIAYLVNAWCGIGSRNVPRSIMGGGGRIATQGRGGPYVVIWEKK